MNTPVSFELAKLLKEKGFDERCNGCYDEKGIYGFTAMSIKQYYTNSKEDTWNFAAPTIAEVVMWLYRKFGIWIYVSWRTYYDKTVWYYYFSHAGKKSSISSNNSFNSPTEAYEAAIEYCLIFFVPYYNLHLPLMCPKCVDKKKKQS